jgi:putative zinc ribbon protein
MKSAKQKRTEIRIKREKRSRKKSEKPKADTTAKLAERPINVVAVNVGALAHNNTYGPLPLFYVDKPFVCRDCGKAEVWTATQQKWWYEVAKGHIDSHAVRCRACRRSEQQRRAEARRVHMEGLAKKKQVQQHRTP